MPNSGHQEVVMLYNADEQIQDEMLYSVFAEMHSGEFRLEAYAASVVKAAYCVVGNGFSLRGVVFFLFKVCEDGVLDPRFNLPLPYLAEQAGTDEDLGHGPIYQASRGRCAVPWHSVNLWEPAAEGALTQLQARLEANALQLPSIEDADDAQFFADVGALEDDWEQSLTAPEPTRPDTSSIIILPERDEPPTKPQSGALPELSPPDEQIPPADAAGSGARKTNGAAKKAKKAKTPKKADKAEQNDAKSDQPPPGEKSPDLPLEKPEPKPPSSADFPRPFRSTSSAKPVHRRVSYRPVRAQDSAARAVQSAELSARLNQVFGREGKVSMPEMIRLHSEQLAELKARYREDIEQQQAAYLDQLREARDEVRSLKVALRQEQGRNRRLQQLLRGGDL